MSVLLAAWSKSFLAGLVSLLLGVGVVTTHSVAAAAPLDPASPAMPATVTADALPTVQINGVAWAQVVVGNTVYVAGKFTPPVRRGAAPAPRRRARNNLLAYDIRTGELITSFAPSLNAQALALAASPDGSRIYVGGDFTVGRRAAAQPHRRLQHLHRPAGRHLPPAVNAQVRAIAATDTTVYLGGDFSAVGTCAAQPAGRRACARRGAAAVGPQPGVGSTAGNRLPNGPTRTPDEQPVLALVLAGPGGQVVVGGRFDSLNGTKATGVGALDGVTRCHPALRGQPAAHQPGRQLRRLQPVAPTARTSTAPATTTAAPGQPRGLLRRARRRRRGAAGRRLPR